MFSWTEFLRSHNIPYVTDGPNASRNRINIKCPFCADDPSEHMGIRLDGRGWSCWRNPHSHSGSSAAYLVSTLIGCSREEANRLVAGATAVPTDDLLLEKARALGAPIATPLRSLTMPREFKKLDNGSVLARPFLSYLNGRGYTAMGRKWLIETYDLRYATTGRFAYRIIIPVYDQDRNLLTWTARSIVQSEPVRYLALRREEQVCATKETLLGLPLLHRARVRALLVCEGPFDAMWVTLNGEALGVYGTCLFGLALSGAQIELLYALRRRVPYIGLLLDASASFQAFQMLSSGVELDVLKMPGQFKDPADMPSEAIIDLAVSALKKSR